MEKILTVDDSSSIRNILTTLLTSEGYEVVEAENGEEALQQVKNKHFDLILVDYNMPGMDGIMLIKQLRQLPNYKFTPILMVTTESSQSVIEEGQNAGATGWIVKPFKIDMLINSIKRVLG